jgi:hypothetical protein
VTEEHHGGPVVPESLKPYFGHDKVALYGSGGMPAAPPAPPGSPARRQGEVARDDALAKVGTQGPRVGERPVVKPPRPAAARRLRMLGENVLFSASMHELARREVRRAPHDHVPAILRSTFAPAYRAIPWGLKRRMVRVTSGVKGWKGR